MNKIIFLATIIFATIAANAQTKTGYWYHLNSNSYTKFQYSVSYRISSDQYITTYKINKPAILVIATHDKSLKKVVVIVKEVGGGIFDEIGNQEATYETPSLNLFGIKGNYALLGGDKIPNQLGLKFLNSKFDYVNVHSILGDSSSDRIEFFCF